MIDELNNAITAYERKWQELLRSTKEGAAFEAVRPNAVGWKTENMEEFDRRFAELRPNTDQVHIVWLNDRWIATIVLRDVTLHWGIRIIKLMQRRPNSTDAVGLDHIDFYAPDFGGAHIMQAKEPDLRWTDEANGLCQWTSLWFSGTEAKFRRESVIDVSVKELGLANKRIMGSKV